MDESLTPDDEAAPPLAGSEQEVDELLAEIDAIAAQWAGEFDSAAEIRQMRKERDEQIGGRIDRYHRRHSVAKGQPGQRKKKRIIEILPRRDISV
jgi:hypothetical protein